MTRFVMLLIPNMTQLDFTGPYEVFVRCPNASVELVWKTLDPVKTEYGLTITPTSTFATAAEPDVIFVPGGSGVNALLNDETVLGYLRRNAEKARYITSACTGALVLAAAGLLRGKKATTHWTALEMLGLLGAVPVKARVVIDGNVVTGGGVTAGIDFALKLASELYGDVVAQTIQLGLEYNPAPPFSAGHPDVAPPAITAALWERLKPRQAERLAQVHRAAERLVGMEEGSK